MYNTNMPYQVNPIPTPAETYQPSAPYQPHYTNAQMQAPPYTSPTAAPSYQPYTHPATTPPQAPPDARAMLQANGGSWPQAATPAAATSSWMGGAYAAPNMTPGIPGWQAGATQLGPHGPSFAGPGVAPMPYGAGASQLGTQGPSQPQAGVEQQLAMVNQRLNSFLGQVGQPAGGPPLEGHEWMASVISPPPENPNNYLGGIVNGGK